jgi:hypothetical protein
MSRDVVSTQDIPSRNLPPLHGAASSLRHAPERVPRLLLPALLATSSPVSGRSGGHHNQPRGVSVKRWQLNPFVVSEGPKSTCFRQRPLFAISIRRSLRYSCRALQLLRDTLHRWTRPENPYFMALAQRSAFPSAGLPFGFLLCRRLLPFMVGIYNSCDLSTRLPTRFCCWSAVG